MSLISIVVPTIAGREHWLSRCVSAYERNTQFSFELIVERDHAACGLAWRAGAEKSRGAFIHFTADDIEPHEGWDLAAVAALSNNTIPSARILNTDGTLQSCGEWGQELPDGTETYIARVPFITKQLYDKGGWILPTHYYTDNWFSERGRQLGVPTVIVRDYLFTHHFAPEGRLDAQMQDEYEAFKQAVQRGRP